MQNFSQDSSRHQNFPIFFWLKGPQFTFTSQLFTEGVVICRGSKLYVYKEKKHSHIG